TNARIALNILGKTGTQAAMHSITQGFIQGISGGDFSQGFWSALVSSTVSSITDIVNSSIGLSGVAGDASTMFFGTVSGGITAEFSGGHFWQGAATGFIARKLNHVAHKMSESKIALDCEKCQKYIEEASRKGGNTDLQKHKEEAVSLKKWVKLYESKTFEEIIHEMPNSTGMPGGPKVRYVINPYDGNVMDMRHVMVVGFIYGRIVGDVVENLQSLSTRTSSSAYDAQDWYSNDIGARYYNYRFRTRGFSGKSKNFAQGFSNWLYYDNK